MTIPEGKRIASFEIMDDYFPRDEEKICLAITYINKNLLRAKGTEVINPKELETTYLVSSLAMNYIEGLSKTVKEKLYQIKDQLYDQLLDQDYQQNLAYCQELKEIQKRLYRIFCVEMHRNGTPPPKTVSEFIEKEDLSNQHIVTTFSLNDKRVLSKDEISAKKQQIKFVKEFGRRFMRDYYPIIIQGKTSSPSDPFLQHSLSEFMETFPNAIPHFLFHAPKVVEQHEKDIIISVLEQITNFFNIYNISIGLIKKSDKDFEGRGLEDKETIILSKMHSITKIKHLPSFIPENFDEVHLLINLSNILKTIISQYYLLSDPNFDETPEALQKFYASNIPLFIVPLVFQRILSPHLFRVLFINLLLRDIVIPDDIVDSPDFKDCDSSDLTFTKQVGEIAQKLTHEILKFGEAKGIINGVKFIASKDSLGELIQKGINHVMGTDTCFIPITLLDQLLYHNGRPTLIEAFKDTTQESIDKVEEDVKKRIYEILIEKLPSALAWATDTLTSVDSFCETTSKRIFELTQSKKLFILFSCYFLEGLREGLSNPVPEEKIHS